MTKKTKIIIILSTLVPILAIVIINQKRKIDQQLKHEVRGIIKDISNAGKGSKKILITTAPGAVDSVYWRGLGTKDGDIVLGDSVATKYDLIYKKEFSKSF